MFILISGLVLKFIEKDFDGDGEQDSFFQGWGEGAWLSLTTASTVGFGDTSPKTPVGRLAASFIMLIGISYFGVIVGIATSAWDEVSGVEYTNEKLMDMKIATVEGSTSQQYLTDHNIPFRTLDGINDCAIELYKGTVDLIMYDECVLNEFRAPGYDIPEKSYISQQYGIVVPQGNSKLRDNINNIIWKEIGK